MFFFFDREDIFLSILLFSFISISQMYVFFEWNMNFFDTLVERTFSKIWFFIYLLWLANIEFQLKIDRPALTLSFSIFFFNIGQRNHLLSYFFLIHWNTQNLLVWNFGIFFCRKLVFCLILFCFVWVVNFNRREIDRRSLSICHKIGMDYVGIEIYIQTCILHDWIGVQYSKIIPFTMNANSSLN